MKTKYLQRMEITDRVCIITGGGGLIGLKHAEAVVEGGGIPVLLDIVGGGMERNAGKLKEEYGDDVRCECIITDITSRESRNEWIKPLVSFRFRPIFRHPFSSSSSHSSSVNDRKSSTRP